MEELSLINGAPFLGILLSIAFGPLVLAEKWHMVENYIFLFWGGLGIVSVYHGLDKNIAHVHMAHTMLEEYLPFVCILIAMYVVSSGIKFHIHRLASPLYNVGFLLFGGVLANFIGTTGASMLLIRPYLHINRHKERFAYGVIFFIFIVSNCGGCLTPVGDPPLFLGYLNGVPFWWILEHLWFVWLGVLLALSAIFFVFDKRAKIREKYDHEPEGKHAFKIEGKRNFVLLPFIIGMLVLTGVWKTEFGIPFGQFVLYGHEIARDVCLVIVSLIAYSWSPKKIRDAQLVWAPLLEVVKVFAVIFITLIPVSLMLKQGVNGPFGHIIRLTETGHPAFNYFWLTGLFSAFLDNAPTYLVFFKMAGGDAEVLSTTHEHILMAISLGAVFMGALTYIGNAPNFMVKAIAKNYKIPMPNFMMYMVWSFSILIPIMVGVTFWLLW
jgi:Na+/H+ antiporter NhaD/arsenite permease-like protein